MTAASPTSHDSEPTCDEAPTVESTPVEPNYERVDLDRYVVLDDGPVGYVEVVAQVFVCYAGHPYPRAAEIAQVYDFAEAVKTVIEYVASSRDPKLSA